MKRIEVFFILTIVVSSLFATKALWHTGLFTSHDGPHQAVRLFYYEKAIADGQLPPRYILESLHGFGYPLFIFSYHLPWLASIPLFLAGISLYDCIKIIFIITYLLSGLTMYWWQKRLWKSELAAFIGAFLYLWAPFRFSDIFVRGSLGEAATYMFLPLAFSGLPLLAAIGIAGVILSHSLIFVLLFPALVLWKILQGSSLQSARMILEQIFIFLLGIGLSAFYFLPAVFLKKYTVFDNLMAGTNSGFSDHFPTIKQLFYSPWGYGFSFPGVGDGMSFQIGIAQWIVVGICILLIGYRFVGARFIAPAKSKQSVWLPLTFLALFFFSIFMMQPVSVPVWKTVNRFAYIDYPWRYLFLTVFSASVLSGWLIMQLKFLKLPKLLKSLKLDVILGVFLLIVALYTNRNHIGVNAWLDWNVRSFVGDGETSNTFDEYASLGYVKVADKDKPKLVEGPAENVVRTTDKITFTATADTDSIYRVNVLYFPQVSLYIDGVNINFPAKSGLLQIPVPAGRHRVEIKFEKTIIEKISLIFSAISGIILCVFLIRKSKAR